MISVPPLSHHREGDGLELFRSNGSHLIIFTGAMVVEMAVAARTPYFAKAMAGNAVSGDNSSDLDDSTNWTSPYIPKSPTDTTCCDGNGYLHRFAFQAQIDALYQTGNGTVDPAKRRAIYFKIQALLADEVPNIFLYWVPGMEALPSNLTGFVGNPFFPSFSTVGSWRRG